MKITNPFEQTDSAVSIGRNIFSTDFPSSVWRLWDCGLLSSVADLPESSMKIQSQERPDQRTLLCSKHFWLKEMELINNLIRQEVLLLYCESSGFPSQELKFVFDRMGSRAIKILLLVELEVVKTWCNSNWRTQKLLLCSRTDTARGNGHTIQNQS